MYTPIVENELKNKNCNDIIHAAWKMTNQTHTKKYIRKLKQKKKYIYKCTSSQWKC